MPPPDRDRWTLVFTAGLLAFVAMLDMNLVTVALPTVQRDLGASVAGVQWLVTGYQLPLTALLLPAGRWLDRVDRRPALTGAGLTFAVATAAVAAAPTLALVAVARVAEGAAAAALFALTPALAAEAVRPASRARAMSVLATLGPLGAVSGPALGGLLVQAGGWRPAFLLTVPVVLAALLVGRRSLPPGRRPAPPGGAWVLEAVALGTAVASVVLAVTLGPGHPGWLLLLPVALLAGAAWRRLPTAGPLLALGRVPALVRAWLAVGGLAAAYGATAFTVPFFLARTAGLGPAATGLTVLVVPLGMLLAGPVGGVLADRWSRPGTATAGAGLVLAGLLLVLPLSPGWGAADLAARLAVVGLGMGLYGGPTQAMAIGAAPPGTLATVAACVQVARNLGFTLGPAGAAGLAAATGGYRAGIGLAVAAAAVGLVSLGAGRRVRAAAPPS